MKRQLTSDIELDDDRQRIDIAEVHRYLSEESYWAKGRPLETVARLISEAARVVALYYEDRLVGSARVVSDGAVIAYLADVWVHPEFRGRGLGTELVREAIENGPHAHLTWILHTMDAHGLYEKFGFGAPGGRVMERPRS